MAGVPRSQALIIHQFAVAEASPAWFGPPGHVTLVKSAYVFNGTNAERTISLEMGTPEHTLSVVLAKWTLTTATFEVWQGWTVMHQDAFLFLRCDGDGVIGWVSGAVLSGPPLFPPAARRLDSPMVVPAFTSAAAPPG